MEEEPKEDEFEVEKSPLKEAYVLLGAKTPLELSNLYSDEDQKLMGNHAWDYNNPNLITNKIKTIIEGVDFDNLTDEEKEWCNEILWFWYHHAISCAIWRHNDKPKAQEYATKAVNLQDTSHPNKITKLLYLLVHDKLEEAQEWEKSIPIDIEKGTAEGLIEDYKEGRFLKK